MPNRPHRPLARQARVTVEISCADNVAPRELPSARAAAGASFTGSSPTAGGHASFCASAKSSVALVTSEIEATPRRAVAPIATTWRTTNSPFPAHLPKALSNVELIQSHLGTASARGKCFSVAHRVDLKNSSPPETALHEHGFSDRVICFKWKARGGLLGGSWSDRINRGIVLGARHLEFSAMPVDSSSAITGDRRRSNRVPLRSGAKALRWFHLRAGEMFRIDAKPSPARKPPKKSSATAGRRPTTVILTRLEAGVVVLGRWSWPSGENSQVKGPTRLPPGCRHFCQLAAIALPITLTRHARATETSPRNASSSATTDEPIETLDPRRFEVAGFPIVGGNSDIGVQLGGAATFTRFHDDVRPYLWDVDLLLPLSFKDDQGRLALVQQNSLAPARCAQPNGRTTARRLQDQLSAHNQRGVLRCWQCDDRQLPGKPSGPEPSTISLIEEEARSRTIARVHTGTMVDFAFGAIARYSNPSAYAGSKLDEDTSANANGMRSVRGIERAFLGTLSAGLMYDTRDSEFVTNRGLFYQLGLGGTVGSSEEVAYGEASVVLAHYAPIAGPFIFAGRAVASFKFGNVPFYELAQGGVFEPQYLFGSDSGVRGVPNGRYSGLVKGVANLEIRSTLPRFVLFEQRLRFGTTTFIDAGRTWSNYTFDSAQDGKGAGIKYGIGGGVFIQWGEAAIFRVEAAYSPDAATENPGFPIGIYVADGLMF